jgi:hypothetical protein
VGVENAHVSEGAVEHQWLVNEDHHRCIQPGYHRVDVQNCDFDRCFVSSPEGLVGYDQCRRLVAQVVMDD